MQEVAEEPLGVGVADRAIGAEREVPGRLVERPVVGEAVVAPAQLAGERVGVGVAGLAADGLVADVGDVDRALEPGIRLQEAGVAAVAPLDRLLDDRQRRSGYQPRPQPSAFSSPRAANSRIEKSAEIGASNDIAISSHIGRGLGRAGSRRAGVGSGRAGGPSRRMSPIISRRSRRFEAYRPTAIDGSRGRAVPVLGLEVLGELDVVGLEGAQVGRRGRAASALSLAWAVWTFVSLAMAVWTADGVGLVSFDSSAVASALSLVTAADRAVGLEAVTIAFASATKSVCAALTSAVRVDWAALTVGRWRLTAGLDRRGVGLEVGASALKSVIDWAWSALILARSAWMVGLGGARAESRARDSTWIHVQDASPVGPHRKLPEGSSEERRRLRSVWSRAREAADGAGPILRASEPGLRGN